MNDSSPQIFGTSDNQQLVDPKTLQFTRRALNSPEEAFELAKRFEQYSRDRIDKSAAIMRKYNDEPPYEHKKLQAAGELWRHNFSTGFMSSLVKRSLPQYSSLIRTIKYLTYSELRDKSPTSEQKTEYFRAATTELIKNWDGWSTLIDSIILEDVLFGYAFAGFLNKTNWRPKFYRQDEVFLYDDISQIPEEWLAIVFKQSYMIHEMARYLEDPELSREKGWNIENLVEAINNAQPKRDSDNSDARRFEDLVRESSVGKSFQNGAKVIETYEVLSQEVSGRVSYYILNAKDGKPLCIRYDYFNSMKETISFFALESGKLQGSKGAGRLLYNLHIAAERSRNMACDNFYLSGMVWLRKTGKQTNRAGLIVNHPFAIVPENYEVLEVDLKSDYEAFVNLDRHLMSIAETLIGAFMPSQLVNSESSKRTASETNYIASLEAQIKDGLLEKFLSHFFDMIHNMQRRIYSADNIAEARAMLSKEKEDPSAMRLDQRVFSGLKFIFQNLLNGAFTSREEPKAGDREAVMTCLDLLKKGLTEQEILELAESHPRNKTQDMSQQHALAVDAVVAKYINDQMVDQVSLKKMDISSKLGNDIAEQLIIDEDDDNIEKVNTRQQLLENTTIFSGEILPTLQSDDDVVHLRVMFAKGLKAMSQLPPNAITPELASVVKAMTAHATEHYQSALSKGVDEQALAEFGQPLQMLTQLLQGVPDPAMAVGGDLGNLSLSQPPGAEPAMSVMPTSELGNPSSVSMESAGAPAAAAQNKPLSRGMPI